MNWQFIRFSSVGIINTTIGLLVIFGIKIFIYDNNVVANAAGYGTGLLISFLLNKSWTFQDNSDVIASGLRFLGAFVISYTFNLGTVLTCIHWFGMNPFLSQTIGVVPYMITFYLLCKSYAFRV